MESGIVHCAFCNFLCKTPQTKIKCLELYSNKVISLLTVIFLVVTVMLWFDERGKDTDGGNHTSWSTPNFPTSL